MPTIYKNQIVILVPEALIPDANSLVACFGPSAADLDTFKAPQFQVGSQKYSIMSTNVTDGTLDGLRGGIAIRPKWDKEIRDEDGVLVRKSKINLVKAKAVFTKLKKVHLRGKKPEKIAGTITNSEGIEEDTMIQPTWFPAVMPDWDREAGEVLPLATLESTALVNVPMSVVIAMYGLVRIPVEHSE